MRSIEKEYNGKQNLLSDGRKINKWKDLKLWNVFSINFHSLRKDCFKSYFVTPVIYDDNVSPENLFDGISSLEPLWTVPCIYDSETGVLTPKEKNISVEFSGMEVCKSLGVDRCSLIVATYDDSTISFKKPIILNVYRTVRICD